MQRFLNECEGKLNASRWLGGEQFGSADKEALIELAGVSPDARSYPHLFAWYSIARGFKV